jgi:uncharacterized membrane protein (DUF485 family)
MVQDDERVREKRKRARFWALVLAAVVLTFYLGFFFLINARY